MNKRIMINNGEKYQVCKDVRGKITDSEVSKKMKEKSKPKKTAEKKPTKKEVILNYVMRMRL